MKIILEQFEGEWSAHCDQYPPGACHTTHFENPVKALLALIYQDIPDYQKFLKEKVYPSEAVMALDLCNKTHEALEGRYDLTGEDLYFIESFLAELATIKSQ